ncbi:dodecin family protein [Pseudonocardia endophytica]|nr:dodecin family protein [Pseudonocardia endophytica]
MSTRTHAGDDVTTSGVRTRGHVAEVVGTSDESVDAAIDEGVSRAAGPREHVEWVEVTEVRSNVLGGKHRYSVELRLGLRRAA